VAEKTLLAAGAGGFGFQMMLVQTERLSLSIILAGVIGDIGNG
jgi:hypothetical protein